LKEKRVMKEETEEKLIRTVLRLVAEEGLTISNIKEAMEKTYAFMEGNARLDKDYQ
jgi:hypothetical protein